LEGHNINTALISAAAAIIASFLTWLGVRRQSNADEAQAYLKASTDMHRVAMDAAAMVRKDLQQELARVENARRDAERMNRDLQAQIYTLRHELRISRDAVRRLADLLKRYVPADTLDEISDLPEI